MEESSTHLSESNSPLNDAVATANTPGPVNPVGVQIESDEVLIADEQSDEGYATAEDVSSYATSIASEIRRGKEENGRLYANYGRHEYGMPIDEQELDRNDLQHTKFQLLLRDRMYLSPIGDNPGRILDIGTGTGIWAIDMADKFPNSQVYGTDIATVQPMWTPPNLQFVLEDAEDEWTFRPNDFDFIFARELFMAIRDWPNLMRQALQALKPGGWFELSASYPRTCCDDGSIDLSKSSYAHTVEVYYQIAHAMGASLEAATMWRQQMIDTGFEDVRQEVFKIPMGPWAKDKRLKNIGVLELAQLDAGYEGYMLRGWTQILGKDPLELQAWMAEGRAELKNRKHHTYCHFYVVYGRKPGKADHA